MSSRRAAVAGGNMRFKIAIIAFLLLALTSFGQQIIENPDKPQSKTAGRVIELKEVLKITDEGGEFYFKYPRDLKVGSDGSIFVMDNEQILRFGKDGKYIRNYFKKGQGPGELTSARSYIPLPQGLCVQSANPAKLIWFDDSGKFLKEISLKPKGRTSLGLLGAMKDAFYFSGMEFPQVTGEPQYIDNPYGILRWTESNDELISLSTFPVKAYVITSGSGGGGMYGIGPFIVAFFPSRYFVLIHTPEYLLKVFDAETKTVIRSISRKYDRIETPPAKPGDKPGGMMIDGKTYGPPRQKYLNDISRVFVRNEAIWVATSTQEPKKGILIDVFNAAGMYLDNFYLNVSTGAQYFICGDLCFTLEKGQDETYAIKKHEILWKN